MTADTLPLTKPADPLDTLLRQLTRSLDPIVGQWAGALLAGGAAIPRPFVWRSCWQRAVWLSSEGDPLSSH